MDTGGYMEEKYMDHRVVYAFSLQLKQFNEAHSVRVMTE